MEIGVSKAINNKTLSYAKKYNANPIIINGIANGTKGMFLAIQYATIKTKIVLIP